MSDWKRPESAGVSVSPYFWKSHFRGRTQTPAVLDSHILQYFLSWGTLVAAHPVIVMKFLSPLLYCISPPSILGYFKSLLLLIRARGCCERYKWFTGSQSAYNVLSPTQTLRVRFTGWKIPLCLSPPSSSASTSRLRLATCPWRGVSAVASVEDVRLRVALPGTSWLRLIVNTRPVACRRHRYSSSCCSQQL